MTIVYTSQDGVQICVGESAKENDDLTSDADPGAHVVARASSLSRETKRDAALLAVVHSKSPTAKMTTVDTCMVRDVQKHPRANHGQVYIQNASTLTVFRHRITEKARLVRLQGARA